MRDVKCSYCEEYRNEWCEKVTDSPHPDILRDCQYFHEAKTRWIPVTERLPDSPKQVLVYARSVHYALAKYDEMREADGSYKKQWVTFDAWKPFYTIKDVIAWQTLPEPYEEEKE